MAQTATLRRWLPVAILVVLLGCEVERQEGNALDATIAVSASEWQALSKSRVVFAHQSVGQNILDGIQSLAKQAGIAIPIEKSRGPITHSGITHFFVGENGDPASKLKDFSIAMGGGAAQGADIALVKFCYLDFTEHSDATDAGQKYIATLDRLSQQFPKVTFVAVTAPLTIAQSGPKAWIKRVLGRTPSGYSDNARRLEFNSLLRARYEKRGHLFDLARIEAIGADTIEHEGKTIEVLNRAYTFDDGHLNTQAERIVAAHLIKLLTAIQQHH